MNPKLKIVESKLDGSAVEVNLEDAAFADRIMWARKDKDPWTVIELLVEAWAKKWPKEYEAFKKLIEEDRNSLISAKFAETRGGKDLERRWIMVFPLRLQSMIRTQYSSQELPFDRKFNTKFCRKFPFFQIPDRL